MEKLFEVPLIDQPRATRLVTCTLVGSFRFMDLFNQTIDQLADVRVEVLSPGKGKVIGHENGFKLLNSDIYLPPLEAESGFLSSLLRSDFGYILDSGGYVGATSVTEIVIARYFGVPIQAKEPLDPELDSSSEVWREFCAQIEVCPLDQLFDEIEDPTHRIHQPPAKNFRANQSIPDLEELALRVLLADWIKYRGLGEVVKKTQSFCRKLDQPR